MKWKISSRWMLVIQKTKNTQSVLKLINQVLNYHGDGNLIITPKGSLKIGNITVQRKDGDGGRKTSPILQFKINLAELFNE